MEAVKNVSEVKPKGKKEGVSALRISQATQKTVSQIMRKINNKTHGKRVKVDPVIQLALSRITDEDIKKFQANSVTNEEGLELDYKEYTARNGSISFEEFLGKLRAAAKRMAGELNGANLK